MNNMNPHANKEDLLSSRKKKYYALDTLDSTEVLLKALRI